MKANRANETLIGGWIGGISGAMPNSLNVCGNWIDFAGGCKLPIGSRTKAGEGMSGTVGGERIDLGPWIARSVQKATKNRLKGTSGSVKSAQNEP